MPCSLESILILERIFIFELNIINKWVLNMSFCAFKNAPITKIYPFYAQQQSSVHISRRGGYLKNVILDYGVGEVGSKISENMIT